MAPRLLAIMGSGETSPTMAKVHRELMVRVGTPPAPAVLVDTPYGFQENADDISRRATEYFAQSVQHPITVASHRSSAVADPVAAEEALVRLRAARYVFSGPGSPSYALAEWEGTQIPGVLADKVRSGGCVTFASAAAITVGALSIPVYEIYKVGQPPSWLRGLGLTAEAGLPGAVVVPHYDNAEGGNHDTRFCYMGERRLSVLERMLADDQFILGVDEHTACILDAGAGTVSVLGRGVVSLRRHGVTATLEAGRVEPLGILAAMAGGGRAGSPAPATAPVFERSDVVTSPLLDETARLQADFDAGLANGSSRRAVAAVLGLDELVVAWSRDTTQSDHLDRARSVLRGMVVALGEAAERGLGDPRSSMAPLVEALLDARRQARDDRRWKDADAIRDRLQAAGVEVRDTPEGTEWALA